MCFFFSTKSSYEGGFVGGIQFEPYRRLWKTWPPLKVKFFIWLVTWNRCWTSDRLAKGGLPHSDRCALCDWDEEDINHLLLRCSFSIQVWFQALVLIRKAKRFMEWWRWVAKRTVKEHHRGLNTFIQLTACCIWKARNRCVFDGVSPDL